MKKESKWNTVMAAVFSLVIILSFPGVSGATEDGIRSKGKAKNIIFMVPDGLGLSNVTAARIFKNGPDGDPLYLETLPKIGYQRTHAKNSTVTDSAAAASAWACGEKFNNNEVSCHDDDKDGHCDSEPVKTILELAKEKGKATGLVATSTITHATPAVWGAHVYYRNCETEIFRQYIEETGVDVILGGGIGPDVASCKTKSPKTADQLIAGAQAYPYGYAYAQDRSDLISAMALGKKKLLGL